MRCGRWATSSSGLRLRASAPLSWLAAAVALACVVFYLAQFMTMAPYALDGGLILSYVTQVAHGERPYFDFVDAYGPLAWLLPARAFSWSGDQVWGIRVFLLLLKTASVGLTFWLVWRMSGLLWGALASLWMTILLGVPWPYAQTAFPFHQTLPLTLATWLLLLVQPLRVRSWNWVAAGVATTLTIWLKLNTGLFLLAAGLLYCFCWMPAEPDDRAPAAPWPDVLRALRWLGLLAYGVVFALFVREHFEPLYLLYLGVPLALALAAAALEAGDARRRAAPVATPLRAWAIYLGTVLGASGLYVAAYFGRHTVAYVRELYAILSRLDYASPLPPLGVPGLRVGLNEYYWLQLPWAVTAAYLAWWLVADRRPYPAGRAALHGLWIFVALGSFVLYSRADEVHIYQALVPAAPALFVYLGRLVDALAARWGRGLALRAAAVLAALAYGSTLAVQPSLDALRWGPGEWAQESLRHIDYRPASNPYRRPNVPQYELRQRDVWMDAAAAYIDELTEDGSEILVLERNELLYFLSDTRPANGRYNFLFYLVKVHLLDPDGFRELVPRAVVDRLIADPPPVIVSGVSSRALLGAIPELEPILLERYEVTGRFGIILVFEPR